MVYLEEEEKKPEEITIAECSECHRIEPVDYLYGGKYPLCRSCAKEILD